MSDRLFTYEVDQGFERYTTSINTKGGNTVQVELAGADEGSHVNMGFESYNDKFKWFSLGSKELDDLITVLQFMKAKLDGEL